MKKTISIIGGGPAALSVAAFLDPLKFDITIYEKNKSLGRKFLVAGKGGFNLTHSEPIKAFIKKYTPNNFIETAITQFDNTALRKWLEGIGIPTFVGSSKRVYPEKGIKPIEVLNAIISELEHRGVRIEFEHTWFGWDNDSSLLFKNGKSIKSDYTIFALGGGSWKVTGSDGNWLKTFSKKEIPTNDFQASNCACKIEWNNDFIKKYDGAPLKNIAIRCDNKIQKGEAVLTQFGIEGNAVYGLSPAIRKQLYEKNSAQVFIDLKPTLTQEAIINKFTKSKYKKTSDILRNDLKLNAVQLDLLKNQTTKEQFLNTAVLTKHIKHLELVITSMSELDEAISTVGGIALESISKNFELKLLPSHYCIGEMLDYDAPTGGYLLQSCFSMGAFVAHVLKKG